MNTMHHHIHGELRLPLSLRQPRTLEDFDRQMRHIQRFHRGSRIWRPAEIEELTRPHAGPAAPVALTFWDRMLKPTGPINPVCKSWCFRWLTDSQDKIVGLWYAIGMTPAAVERHLRPDLDELPCDELSWDQLYVLDPARSEQGRHLLIYLQCDWNFPDWTSQILESIFTLDDLFIVDTIISQLAHVGPPHEIEWDHNTMSKFRMEFSLEQVAQWTAFHQSLRQDLRRELVRIAQGYDARRRALASGVTERTIRQRRPELRGHFEAIGVSRGLAVDLSGFHEEEGAEQQAAARKATPLGTVTADFLRTFGITQDTANLADFSSLIRQSGVVQALQKIAWFYEELPSS